MVWVPKHPQDTILQHPLTIVVLRLKARHGLGLRGHGPAQGSLLRHALRPLTDLARMFGSGLTKHGFLARALLLALLLIAQGAPCTAGTRLELALATLLGHTFQLGGQEELRWAIGCPPATAVRLRVSYSAEGNQRCRARLGVDCLGNSCPGAVALPQAQVRARPRRLRAQARVKAALADQSASQPRTSRHPPPGRTGGLVSAPCAGL